MAESFDQDTPSDPEKMRQEEAATKVQAAFRGYVARRAFLALKGIIRLQALIHGQLARRQAVATLCCMYRIVKFQALVRGGRVRQSDIGIEIHEKCSLFKTLDGKLSEPLGISKEISKLSANIFICKLLASSSTIKILHLQYVPGDPNSVLSWLERWSASYFWKPVPHPKKIRESKSHQRKHCNISIGEALISKPKRTNRKLPIANYESVPMQTNPEFEKAKRNFGKFSSQSDPEQENPQSELEKVKRNLRKIQNHVENAIMSEVECDTPKQHLEKATVIAAHAVSEQEVTTSDETIKNEPTVTISNVPDVEFTPIPSVNKDVYDIPSSISVFLESEPLTETITKDSNTSGNEVKSDLSHKRDLIGNKNYPSTDGDLSHKGDLTGDENQKPTRKSSILSKSENAENVLQNSPTVPSYMAATESAKAKLRTQRSPRSGQDGTERNNTAERHSLPSLTNGKINSHSPRTQRSVKAGGQGGYRGGNIMIWFFLHRV